MWIRSQNKTRLLKVNYVRVNDNCVEAIPGDMLYILIGRYSTEEKALKVLDMIEKHLNTQSKIVEKSMSEYIISDMNSIIFQMPQDEEVKGGEKGD